MQIRSSTIMVPLLAAILVSPVVQAIGKPSSDARVTATARSWRADLAVLQAPIGHRQPTLEDLPPWLREKEKPDTQANPAQDSQQRQMPKVRPDDGVPRICDVPAASARECDRGLHLSPVIGRLPQRIARSRERSVESFIRLSQRCGLLVACPVDPYRAQLVPSLGSPLGVM